MRLDHRGPPAAFGGCSSGRGRIVGLRELLTGRKRGDTIFGRVGDDARGVAIGKNIVQIGTLVVPTRLVLIAVGVVAMSGLVWAGVVIQALRAPTGPAVMTGPFKVAVASFGQIGEDGRVRPSEEGRLLSKWIFTSLQGEYKTLPRAFVGDVDDGVWHDSMDRTRKGATIGTVLGETDEARNEAAAALAGTIQADVVVYGNLVAGQRSAGFAPAFYVRRVGGEADEIVGAHRLGTLIGLASPFTANNPEVGALLNEEVQVRAAVLVRLTVGLIYDLAGRPERALEVFRSIEKDFPDWREGREVLYLFIGREARATNRLGEALRAFEEGLRANPEYARGYVGLGNVHHELAGCRTLAGRVDQVELRAATEAYERALRIAARSEERLTQVKARLGWGSALHCRGEALRLGGARDQAGPFFDQALQQSAGALTLAGDQEHRQIAHAHLLAGMAYSSKAAVSLARGEASETATMLRRALDAYAQCIEHADVHADDWFLKEIGTRYCGPYADRARAALPLVEPSKQ
jgi:tetratricopeptide (TPR) repeat protein